MKNIPKIFLIIIFFSFYAKSKENNSTSVFRNDLKALIGDSSLQGCQIGVSIWSLSEKRELFSHNSQRNFTPASLVKLFTTYSGLHFLGSEYRYKTNLYLNGRILESGELDGDLIVWSNGDPSHSENFVSYNKIFSDWTLVLDSLGVSSINGSIIGDLTYFDSNRWPLGWSWDDLQYGFGAEVQSLNFNDNSARIIVSQGVRVGAVARVRIIPNNSYIKTLNNVVTVGNKYVSDVEFYREAGSNVVELSGRIGFNEKRPIKKILNIGIDNSGKYFLYNFRDHLLESNFIIRGGDIVIDRGSGLDLSSLVLINSQNSDSLGRIIKIINSKSVNLYAEILLKTIGKEKTGIGSFEKGLEQIDKVAKGIGIDSGLELYDGSGLSRMNLMSPNAAIELLSSAYDSEHRNVFMSSLGRPGREGTLERRMKRSKAKNRIWAKTGTMTNISNICGYVKTEEGEMLAFALFFNNYTVSSSKIRGLQDLICLRLASYNSKENE